MRLVIGFAIFLFGLSSMAAEGHATGNGGGVLCIAGKCQTLIEAGLQVRPEYEGVWIPDSDHFKRVEQKVNSIFLASELKQDLYYNTFLRSDHFRQVEVIDPLRLQVIKDQYLKLAAEAGFAIDPATFEVVAFSSDDTVQPAMTYLLPQFFKLDAQEQANILFHEGLYRGRPTGFLKYVLQFESSMHTLSEDRWACFSDRSKDFQPCINQQIAAYRLGYLSESDLFGALLSLLETNLDPTAERPSYFNTDRFGELALVTNPVLKIDPRKILSYAKIDSRIPYLFSKLGTIPLKFISMATFDTSNKQVFVDWRGRGATKFRTCKEYYRDGNLQGYSCDIYQIDPAFSLKLVLPN